MGDLKLEVTHKSSPKNESTNNSINNSQRNTLLSALVENLQGTEITEGTSTEEETALERRFRFMSANGEGLNNESNIEKINTNMSYKIDV